MERKEFENDLLSGNVTEKYLRLSKDELKERFGEEFLKTVEFGDQNNTSHQYELFEHILRTVDSISTEGLSNEDLTKVKVAAFFHDIGKPNVAALNEKTGKTQFIGHAKESANIANSILENIGYSQEEIDEIDFLIQCHDDFIPIAKKEDATPQRISKIFASMNKKLENYSPTISDIKKLISLCKADTMAQNDVIKKNDEVVDTKEDRLARLDTIMEVFPEAIIMKEEQEIEKLNQQKETLQNGPKPIEKKGKIVNQKQIDIWNNLTEEEKQEKMKELDEQITNLKREEDRLLEMDKKEEAQKLGFDKVKYLSDEMLEEYIHKQKALELEGKVSKIQELNSEISQAEKTKEEK